MDDFTTLARDGFVVRRCASLREAEDWRGRVRRAARSERLRVRTGTTGADSLVVWALLAD
jgi:hypothetical protein